MSIRSWLRTTCALLAGLTWSQQAHAVNLLVNGGFEAPVQGAPNFATFNIPAGSTLITGWNVVQGNVDLTTDANYGPGNNTINPASLQDVDLIGDTTAQAVCSAACRNHSQQSWAKQYQLTFNYSHNNGTSCRYAAQVTVADANAPANTVLSVERSHSVPPTI